MDNGQVNRGTDGRADGAEGRTAAYGRAGVRGGANLPALRGHNEALLLDLVRGAGPTGLGRAELAARTGLTPQAVSKIAARLAAEGLLADAGRAASTGGKPRTLLRLAPQARHALGVHLDRDELRAVRVDLAGAVLARTGGPLDFGAGPEAAAGAVVRAVVRLADPSGPPLLGVGVAAPGPLDHRTGVLGRVTGFPGWEGYPLREVLERRLGLPVVLDKDTNAGAALAGPARPAASAGEAGAREASAREFSAREAGARELIARAAGDPVGPAGPAAAPAPFAATGPADSVYLHVGTGLGAGLRLGGRIHRGVRSAAGEFGHQVLRLDGPPCRCGARGCAEVLCLDAVARGDLPGAARILGEGAANLVALLDVDHVLLGGRVVASAPEVFVAGVRAVLEARSLTPDPPAVAPAPGEVAQGAAELCLAPFFGRA
ncbi:transcriptional regulator [Streptomyces subrutilus]|uniref:Transcriptional regulator n=1 Tax=Streptomyces subrutilus TaxID=36818 RepID=A0A918V6T7_9ACTN|nr:transcriptional regulator [Streptomyces subrutilus]